VVDYKKQHKDAAANVIAYVQLATPEWAADLLQRNTRNRKLVKPAVERIRDAIAAGRWEFNAEPVILDRDDVLIDGQHRLQAIVEAGIAVPLLVVEGVQPAVFSSLDQGRSRSRADVLSIPNEAGEREQRTNTLAGAIVELYRWEHGDMGNPTAVPDNAEVLAILARHPGIRDSVSAVAGNCTKGIHSPVMFSALHYLFGMRDAAARDRFFARVLDGIGIEEGSAEATLYRYLKNKAGSKTQADRMATYAVLIKAWNCIRTGAQPPAYFVWKPGDVFPEIK
jgi:hypothetical protein